MQTSNPEVGSSNIVNANMKSRKKRKADVTKDVAHSDLLPKKRTKGKAKAGQLEGLMALPMDILFEVIYYLLWLHFIGLPTAF